MGDLLQFPVRTPVQPRAKFYSAGVLQDLDGPAGGTCTVTLKEPDGTDGPASGTVTHVASTTGTYSFVLDGPADPFYYDIAWSGQIGGRNVVQTTRAEALGELLFTLPELRALYVGDTQPFTDATKYPDERLMEARTATLNEFAHNLGFSPVPRFARETHNGDGAGTLVLDERECSKLLSVTVGGAAGDLAGYTLQSYGILECTSGYLASGRFPTGRANVIVEYVHGWARVVGDGSNMAMLRAAARLAPSMLQAASQVVTPDGTSYSNDFAGQVTASGRRRRFGMPQVDAWLDEHRSLPIGIGS
jgi:hypothetical protein